nr:glycosyltransferase family A protein [bacterium]
MRKNKISVVICVFNGGKYIADCVDSVLKNIESNDELIIVNDGSTDNTESELAKFSNRLNIKIISYKKNKGLAAARNAGWQSASNDIIFYIDSDVEMPESALNVLDEYADKYPGCSGFTGRGIETKIISKFDLWRKEFF